MKKFIFILFFVLFVPSYDVFAQEVPIYLFYGDTCPICEKEREFLNELKSKYDNIVLYEFETYRNRTNYQNMLAVKELFTISSPGVPFTVIGDVGILGFSDMNKERYEFLIKKYTAEEFHDRTGIYLGYKEEVETITSTSVETIEKEENKADIPISIILIWSFVFVLISIVIFGILKVKYHKSWK